ncbi:hypothetical protein D3C84_1005840 [compost metagenome]
MTQGLGDDPGGQAVFGVVQHRQGLLEVAHADHAGNRPEHFFAVDAHLVGGIDEQRGAHVVPGRFQGEQLAAFDQGGAVFLGQVQVMKVLFQLAGLGDRADLHTFFKGMADLQLAHAGDQCLDKTVMDAVADDQAR